MSWNSKHSSTGFIANIFCSSVYAPAYLSPVARHLYICIDIHAYTHIDTCPAGRGSTQILGCHGLPDLACWFKNKNRDASDPYSIRPHCFWNSSSVNSIHLSQWFATTRSLNVIDIISWYELALPDSSRLCAAHEMVQLFWQQGRLVHLVGGRWRLVHMVRAIGYSSYCTVCNQLSCWRWRKLAVHSNLPLHCQNQKTTWMK